jgi:hypothetical protein
MLFSTITAQKNVNLLQMMSPGRLQGCKPQTYTVSLALPYMTLMGYGQEVLGDVTWQFSTFISLCLCQPMLNLFLPPKIKWKVLGNLLLFSTKSLYMFRMVLLGGSSPVSSNCRISNQLNILTKNSSFNSPQTQRHHLLGNIFP